MPAGRSRFFAILGLILLVAAGVRVAYVLTETRHDHGFYDAFFYETEARVLAEGKGFINPAPLLPGRSGRIEQTADHPPLTSIVLIPAAWMADGEAGQLLMRFTMVLLGLGAVAVVGLLGREVAGDRVGLVAAGIAALSPAFWMNDGLLMGETLATLTTAAAVLLAYRLRRTGAYGVAAGLGAVCAVAMLSRAELALLVPALAIPVALLARDRDWRRRFGLSAMVLGVSLVLVAPWVIYNLTRFDEATFISTSAGNVLRGANCDDTYYGSGVGFWSVSCVLADKERGDDSVQAQRRGENAVKYIKAHKARVPHVVAARVGRLWSVYAIEDTIDANRGEGRVSWASWLGLPIYYATVVAAIAGTVLLWRRRVSVFPLLVPLVLVTVMAAIFYGIPRFRAPAEPSLAVLAAVAVVALFQWLDGRRRTDPDVPSTRQPAEPSTTVASSSS